MHRLLRTLTIAVASLVLVAPGAAFASGAPIKAGQHFVGLVNGSHKDPVVYTVCPGPVGPGRTGPVAGGQHVSVVQVVTGGGYTGHFSSVHAWFVPVPGGPAPTQLTFRSYKTPQAIPTSIQVPCDGKGKVVFSSCPYLAPCAAGWVPYGVHVRFVDIAV